MLLQLKKYAAPWKKAELFSMVLLSFVFFIFAYSAEASTIARPMNNDELIAYWDFNIGKGDSTAYDKSGNSKHGTFVNLDSSASWVDSKTGLGQAIAFDETNNEYIAIPDESHFDFAGNQPFSIAFWFKTPDPGVQWATWISKGDSAWTISQNNSTNEMLVSVMSNSGANYETVTSSGTVDDNDWHHATYVYDGGTTGTLYLDGVQNAQNTSQIVGTLTPNNFPVAIGYDEEQGDGTHYDGLMDEARIYRRALSAGEIERLYKLGGNRIGKTPTAVSDGLVGHWTFDGGELTSIRAINAAGSGNNGTLVNGPTPVLGTIGQALNFNGSSQYIGSIGDIGDDTGNVSVAAWVNGADFTAGVIETIVSKEQPGGSNNSFVLRVGDVGIGTDQLQWGIIQSNGTERKLTSKILDEGRWYHVVATYNTAGVQTVYIDGVATSSQATADGTLRNNGVSFEIGRSFSDSGRVWDGLLDDVRLYNKELSADEVARIYHATRPSGVNVTRTNDSLSDGLVGHWTFDGSQLSSTAAYDSSVTNLSGTLVSSPEPTIGKIGQALEFSGANRVTVPDNAANDLTAEATWSAWIYPKASHTGRHAIIGKWFQPTSRPYQFGYDTLCTDNYLALRVKSDQAVCGTSAIPQNTWSHVAATYNSGSVVLYLNGEVTGSGSPVSGNLDTNNNLVGVGAENDNGTWTHFFTGIIDDARMYNRALGQEEIRRLYNLGS